MKTIQPVQPKGVPITRSRLKLVLEVQLPEGLHQDFLQCFRGRLGDGITVNRGHLEVELEMMDDGDLKVFLTELLSKEPIHEEFFFVDVLVHLVG